MMHQGQEEVQQQEGQQQGQQQEGLLELSAALQEVHPLLVTVLVLLQTL